MNEKVEMVKNNTGFNQLIILIEPAIHQDIRTRATFHNTSLKGWVLQAIAEKIIREDRVK